MKESILLFHVLLVSIHYTTTLSQSPATSPVQPPTPQPLPDTVMILLKASHFQSFVRLIKATHVDTQLPSQLNSSTDGITIFAPTDAAFSSLRRGAIDSLKNREKLELVQFHILPKFLSISDFQTLSNPVKTLAGSAQKFPLTITTSDSSVNISSGETKTSISGTVYNDKQQVAIYQVDKVILPKNFLPPAPAPAPEKSQVTTPDVVKSDSTRRNSFLGDNEIIMLLLAVNVIGVAVFLL